MKVLNVLVVDDDVDDHFFFTDAIRRIDKTINVYNVYNGIQAIDFLLNEGSFKDGHYPKPDLIISDINMPLCNGLEFLKKVKNFPSLKSIPVYVFSTSTDDSTKETVSLLGADHFYSKPSNPVDYERLIAPLIHTVK